MRKYLVKLLNELLPQNWFNFLLMKPRPMLVDIHTAKTVKWVRKQGIKGINFRGEYSSYLRKQAHILEKGIQAYNREAGHSKAQYEKVKRLIEKSECDITNQWASNILSKYESLQKGTLIESDVHIDIFNSNISKTDFYEFTKARRSIRNFKKEKIDNDLLAEIASLLNWAPNSCNRQTAKLYATDDDGKISECMRLNGGATCMNTPSHFMTLTSNTLSYMLPVEYSAAYIDASLAAQNFILALHANGIGSCVLNWTHASAEQNEMLREKMCIPDNELIVFNLVIGYPEKNIYSSSKKSIDETLVLNTSR
ncbi:nitroreductase family protein [Vibrio fluvialis]|uniref:nitroreductase family protein n=1 Tax=Vibrio fluvialis TaxID=676 RepID=UPI0005C838C6|nr:nitroreductase family protein [Vibrio fluvialis]